MKQYFRTTTCGALTKQNEQETVVLAGWIQNLRIAKALIFLDLRDAYGITQVIIKADSPHFNIVKKLKLESVIQVTGVVACRNAPNLNLATGEIEVVLQDLVVLNAAHDLPFVIKDETTALEDLRLEYRYLDLRRPKMHQYLTLKHQLTTAIREFLNNQTFLEIETPCLTKSTPEGARDFLVPARLKKNHFYALPQSPQLYKQLLMVSGVDRYYQIAKCFRDEDFRADRQPEFQQLDVEMAFANQEDVMNMTESMLQHLWMKLNLPKISLPLPKMSYHDSIEQYGTDKPDLRCDCQIINFGNLDEQLIRGFWVNDQWNSNLQKNITRISQQHNGKNLLVCDAKKQKIVFSTNHKLRIPSEVLTKIVTSNSNETQNLCFITIESTVTGAIVLGAIRTEYCNEPTKQQKHSDFLLKINDFCPLWIVDWPLFEEVNGQLAACHHPFTKPTNPELIMSKSQKEILKAKATAYDLVINGSEVGGGSVRIVNKALQMKIFQWLNLTENVVNEQFGFFLKAFDYGIPPHAGIAFGLDRLLMIISKANSIRDFIAFPKNNSGVCLLTAAPSRVNEQQLTELGLKIIHDKSTF